jgi:hypothetical protein
MGLNVSGQVNTDSLFHSGGALPTDSLSKYATGFVNMMPYNDVIDTVKVVFLITHSTCRKGIAHAEKGYLIRNTRSGICIVTFLNRKKKPFDEESIIWDYKYKP